MNLYSEQTGSNIFDEYIKKNLDDEDSSKPIVDLIYEVLTLNYRDVRRSNEFKGLSNEEGLNKLNLIKLEAYQLFREYFYSTTLFDDTKQLFDHLFTRTFTNDVLSFEVHQPRLNPDDLGVMIETILCIDKFIHHNELKNLISKSEHYINNLIAKIWGSNYKYPRLLEEHRNSIEYFKINEGYRQNEIIKLKDDGTIDKDEKIIFNVKNPTIIMKDGKNFNFDPGQQDIWLPYGNINYGLVHLLTGRGKTGHFIDFLGLDARLNNPQKIAKFIYDRITKGTGVIMNNDGIVVYAFRFKDQSTVYYLAVYISGSEGINIGRAFTSFPVLTGTSNFDVYDRYFGEKGNNRPIETNVEIDL
ncbi:MAG: hypothetical protein P8Y70_20840 [Candidatus Lokiarchaeota archaeon]